MAGVHPNLARRIGNELVALCEEGMTILMVEHELAIMDEFCDPVVVVKGPSSPRGRWKSCAGAARSWRPTLSAELALHGLPLRAEKVTAGYGGDPVIRDITVSADPGEVVSLVGPNGSGKVCCSRAWSGWCACRPAR